MNYLATHSGLALDYQNPRPSQIKIEDIARGLANECRFNGQVNYFYSVAQHSVYCSYIVSQEYALEALLHDAAEAYCKDIPSPLKQLLPDYREIEKRIQLVIRRKFELPTLESPDVKAADLSLLAAEKKHFHIENGEEWAILHGISPTNRIHIAPMSAADAYTVFMSRFNELLVNKKRNRDNHKATPISNQWGELWLI